MYPLLLLLISALFQTPPLDQYQAAQNAFAANPKSEDRLVVFVTLLFRMGQNERAVGLLDSFVQANPKASRAKVLLAAGYVREEKYDRARSLASQATAEIPADHYAQHVLAQSLFGLNRFDEAERGFRRAIELKPDFSETHFRLGLLLAGKSETLEQARASFERALELGYPPAEARKEIGAIEIKLGRYSQAIEQLNASLKLNPVYVEAHFLLADAFRKSGEVERAAEAIKKFQTLNASEQDRRSRQNRSQAAYEEGMRLLFGPGGVFIDGNFPKAYEAFRKAVEALPELDAAHYRMAQIDYLRGDHARAVQNARVAVNLNPLEPEYYFVLASSLKDSDTRGAIEAASKAVSLHPGVADFHNLLGVVLDKAGDYPRAAASYRRASELDPGNEAFKMNLTAVLRKIR